VSRNVVFACIVPIYENRVKRASQFSILFLLHAIHFHKQGVKRTWNRLRLHLIAARIIVGPHGVAEEPNITTLMTHSSIHKNGGLRNQVVIYISKTVLNKSPKVVVNAASMKPAVSLKSRWKSLPIFSSHFYLLVCMTM
jgi:hypothetical protein